MVQLSTAQAAGLLNNQFRTSNITDKKILELVKAGLFTNVGSGRSIRIDLAQLQAHAQNAQHVTPANWPTPHLFRVSLLALRDDVIRDEHGGLIRTHAGADYPNVHGLTPQMRQLAWTGVWEVSHATVALAVKRRAILVGTTKGYIHQDYVLQIIGATRDWSTGRIWWETTSPPASVRKFVSAGLWMDVKPGRESDWA